MTGKILLMIENDIDLRESLHFSFERDGYEVFDAGTRGEKEKNRPFSGGEISGLFFKIKA